MSLTVISGPDEGKTANFNQGNVSLGRDPRNDFVLSDGFVSGRHAELVLNNGKVWFRDLKSRHGSTVVMGNVSRKLQNDERAASIEIKNGAEIQVGSTLLRVSISSAESTTSQPRGRPGGVQRPERTRMNLGDADSEHVISTSRLEVPQLNEQLESADNRLAVLFQLAGELNGLTALDEILDLIVETTFDAFPATNFFAVTLGSDPEKLSTQQPFLARTRGEVPGDDDEPILSSSLLRRVAKTRESVLFTRDSIGAEVSQSILDAQITACMAAPLVGQKSLLGVMQVDTRGRGSLFGSEDLELFNILASNAAFAIERARLTEDIMEMFEGFVAASVNAIEARDPVTAGHSERVADYTVELAEVVNDVETGRLRDIYLDEEELRELRYAALLHDFGKIAVGEDVIQKGTRLPQGRMELIRQRFETVKELQYRRRLYRHVRSLEADGVAPGGSASDGTDLERLEQQHRQYCQQFDELLEFIEQVATKGYLEDEDIERVKSIGEQTFIGPDGNEHSLLTPSEVENLCIRKGTLNEEEWAEMRSHAALSESYLDQIPWSDELSQVPCIAGAHHEKLDGSGYPKGIAGDELMPQVRMLTISDIFDALTASDRPYRKAATIERAVEILNLESEDNKLDADLVGVFDQLVIPRIKDIVPDPSR